MRYVSFPPIYTDFIIHLHEEILDEICLGIGFLMFIPIPEQLIYTRCWMDVDISKRCTSNRRFYLDKYFDQCHFKTGCNFNL